MSGWADTTCCAQTRLCWKISKLCPVPRPTRSLGTTKTAGQITELLGITKQGIHGPLRDLVDAALVEVVRPDEDRRRKMLELTASGARFERHLARLQHAVFAEAFQRVQPRWRAGAR